MELKGIGRSLLGVIVDLNEKPAPTAPTVAAATTNLSTKATAVNIPSLNSEMVEMLQKKVTSRTTPYTALLENAEILKDVIPDENMRLKAAFKQVTKDGSRSINTIAQAIDLHLTDVEGERSRFKEASNKQIQSKSGSLRSQVATLEQQNSTNQARVESLQSEIARLQSETSNNSAKIVDLSHQADCAEAEIVATAAQFDNAADYVKNDLLSKKASIAAVLS